MGFSVLNYTLMVCRRIRILFGYSPWRRYNNVAIWNDVKTGRAVVLGLLQDVHRSDYIKSGLVEDDVLKSHVKDYTNFHIIIDRTKIPADRTRRNEWIVDYEQRTIGIK